MARPLAWTLVLSALLAGCANAEKPLLAPACLAGPQAVEAALRAAPDAVTLEGGMSLSACVDAATDDGDLQEIGIQFSDVAETPEQRAPTDEAAAVQLGYLVGATRRGAAGTNGVMLEIVRRVERSAALPEAPETVRAAVQRGLKEGARTG